MSDAENVTETKPVAEVAAPEAEAAAPVAEPEAAASETVTPEEKPAEEKTETPAEEEKTETPVEEESKEGAEATEAKDEETKPAEEEIVEEAPEPIEIPEGNGELVLVTGATGFLASHIVKQLVESEQYRVRGTVRTLEGNEKLNKLKSLLGEEPKYPAEFVEADLTQPESWAEAVKDCDYVIHTASPFPSTVPADASEVIEPAKDGALAVLKACVEAGTVKRVVLTSSIVAVCGGRTLDKNACNEEQWADVDKSQSAYDKSKAVTEKAAWEFAKDQIPEGNGMELSVVNPGFMVGPPLMEMDSPSIEVLKKLMNREDSIMPKISFACADVRDVAQGHIRAMVIKQAGGKRHIMCKSSVWLKDMANIMSQEFNPQGFNISSSETPYVLVWFKSHFDPSIKRILPTVGKMYSFDTTRMTQVLQVEGREVRESLLDMGRSMINLGIVQKVEKPEKKSRKMTFRKKKEKEPEDGEEKKDEPEKAASTSGSAENESVPDAAIEEVTVEITEDKPAAEAQTQEEKVEEKVEEIAEVKSEPEDNAAAHSEEEVKDEAPGTSDPESTKKSDKKEKPKKEKKEKKKGGLFSFSFKKNKKPHVEKKAEGETGNGDETTAATEETPATTATEETPAVTITEETPATSATEETPAVTEETPAATVTEEKPAVEASPVTEEAPAATPETTETPAEDKPTEEVAKTEDIPAETTKEETPAATESTPVAEDKPETKEEAPSS